MKLKAHLRVQALIRAYDLHTTPCMVLHKGDPDAGTILVKLTPLDGTAIVFTETRDMDGNPAWRRGSGDTPVPEGEADAYIAKQRDIDRDVWVLEVEDPTQTPRMVEAILS